MQPVSTTDNYPFVGDSELSMRIAGKYSVGGYVRNFTDKRYVKYSIGDSVDVDYTDPRTYGVVLSARF